MRADAVVRAVRWIRLWEDGSAQSGFMDDFFLNQYLGTG